MAWQSVQWDITEESKALHRWYYNYDPAWLLWWRPSTRYVRYLSRRFDEY